MRRLFAAPAFAAVALAVLPNLALADDGDNLSDNGLAPSFDTWATTFDLGIDVTDVAHTPAAARAFLSGLPAPTQSAIMGACENFMAHPDSVQSPETFAFCSNAVRG